MIERGTPIRGRKEISDNRRTGCLIVAGRSQTMTGKRERKQRDERKHQGLLRILGEHA